MGRMDKIKRPYIWNVIEDKKINNTVLDHLILRRLKLPLTIIRNKKSSAEVALIFFTVVTRTSGRGSELQRAKAVDAKHLRL